MQTFNSKFAAELKKGKSNPVSIVHLQESIFFDEKTLQADWAANTAESNVDYTLSPPNTGDVILVSPFTWTQETSGATTRRAHSAIEYNGKMYIFGGYDGTYLNDVWEYDIAGDSWIQKTSGATIRHSHSAIEYNGKMYIFGGYDGTYLNDVWEYDIAGDSWTQKTSGATTRFAHSAIEYNGKMYIFGGGPGASNSVWEYDIAGDSWTQKTSGATTREFHSAIEYNGKMYIFGGYFVTYLNDVWEYDIAGDSWIQKTSGATTRFAHSAIEYNGKMYIFGGYDGTYLNDVWEYDIAGDSWIQKTSGATIRRYPTSVEYNGKMYIFGGQNSTSYLNDVWENHIGFYDTGYITTDNFDLGAVPTVNGEWIFGDNVPVGTSLIYEAWSSATGLSDETITESQTGSDSTSIIASRDIVPRFAQDWQSFKFAVGEFGELKEIKSTFSKSFGGIHAIRAGLYTTREGTQIGVDVVVDLTTSGGTPTELTFDFTSQSLDLSENTIYWIKFYTSQSVPNPGNIVEQYYNSNTASYANGQLDRKSSIWSNNIGDAKFEVTIGNVWGDYIGVIIDGQAITDLKRYYRVKTSFTSNPSRDKTPILSSITADFASYLKIYNPIGLAALTTTIDLFEESTISQMTVILALTAATSNWMAVKKPRNKRVKIFIGFNAVGFTEDDFEKFYFGTVANADITSDDKIKISVEGLAKDWKEDVPSSWEDAGDDITWTNVHPIDVMLDIYRTYLPVRDSALLLDSFYDVKAQIPAWIVTRTITDNPIEGKKLLEELRKLMSCFFIPQPDGSVKIKRWDPSEAAVASITDLQLMSKSYKGNYKEIINRLYIYFGWSGSGDDAGDFNALFLGTRSDSKADYGKWETKTIKDKWTLPDELSQVQDRATKLLDRYEDPPPLLPVMVDLKNMAIEEGDIIEVTTKRAPSTDMTGISAKRVQVVKRQINWQKKTLSWDLLAVEG